MPSFVRCAALALAVLAAAPLTGCAAPTVGEESDDVTSGAKRMLSGLKNPDNLFVLGDRLLYSQASFVASGDPELDQEFAYWTGELWSVALSGGKGKKFAETNGAVREVVGLGNDVLVVDSGYNGVTRINAAGKSTDFYNDYTNFKDEDGDWASVGGIAVGKGAVYITRMQGGEVVRTDTKGGAVTTFAKPPKAGWLEMGEQVLAAGDTVFWSGELQGTQGSTFKLYRATLSGSYKTLATFKGEIESLATDGTNVFIAIGKSVHSSDKAQIAVVPVSGGTPRTLVSDVTAPSELVYDAKLGLLFTDWTRGVMRVEPAAIAGKGVATPKLVWANKTPTAILPTANELFLATNGGAKGQNDPKGEIWRLPRTAIH
jgi:hypothetical protein